MDTTQVVSSLFLQQQQAPLNLRICRLVVFCKINCLTQKRVHFPMMRAQEAEGKKKKIPFGILNFH